MKSKYWYRIMNKFLKTSILLPITCFLLLTTTKKIWNFQYFISRLCHLIYHFWSDILLRPWQKFIFLRIQLISITFFISAIICYENHAINAIPQKTDNCSQCSVSVSVFCRRRVTNKIANAICAFVQYVLLSNVGTHVGHFQIFSSRMMCIYNYIYMYLYIYY